MDFTNYAIGEVLAVSKEPSDKFFTVRDTGSLKLFGTDIKGLYFWRENPILFDISNSCEVPLIQIFRTLMQHKDLQQYPVCVDMRGRVLDPKMLNPGPCDGVFIIRVTDIKYLIIKGDSISYNGPYGVLSYIDESVWLSEFLPGSKTVDSLVKLNEQIAAVRESYKPYSTAERYEVLKANVISGKIDINAEQNSKLLDISQQFVKYVKYRKRIDLFNIATDIEDLTEQLLTELYIKHEKLSPL